MVKIPSRDALRAQEVSRSLIISVLDNPVLAAIVSLFVGVVIAAAFWFTTVAIAPPPFLTSAVPLPASLNRKVFTDPVWTGLTRFGERPEFIVPPPRDLFVYPGSPPPEPSQ